MAPRKYSGKLILFEGPEGAGKSTLIKYLAKQLVGLGIISHVLTKEPGHDTPRGREIREILLNPKYQLSPQDEVDLFIEGRRDHFEKIIIPALEAGKLILCDRSSPSTIAYQHYARGLDITAILVRDAWARQNISFDLIMLLDLHPTIGLKRKKPETRFEQESITFHKLVREGYLEQARHDPDKKWAILNATEPAETVAQKAWGVLYSFLLKATEVSHDE